MKNKLLIIAIPFILVSCGTDDFGNKTFLNRNAHQWRIIGKNTVKEILPIAKDNYDKTATK